LFDVNVNALFLQHIFTGIPLLASRQAAGGTAARQEQLAKFPCCPDFLRVCRSRPDVVLLLPLIMPGALSRMARWRRRTMAGTRVPRARGLRAVGLAVMAVTILAVPRLCAAQDDRSDDPQKPPPKGQAAGTTTVATPTPVATTGVTPAAGTSAPPITPTTTAITGLFKEPELLASGINYALKKFDADDQRNKSGFYVELSNMITGSGWISAGPGYRRWVMNDKAFYDASAAVSWHLYTMAQTRFEAPDLGSHHLQLGVQAMYQDQTQINFFGLGPDSPDLKI
jgi:hypothetical protein